MKQVLLLLLVMPMRVFAHDPDFDSSRSVVTFSRVTVDNSIAFRDVQLLLNSNGTWRILSATPESDFTSFCLGDAKEEKDAACLATITKDIATKKEFDRRCREEGSSGKVVNSCKIRNGYGCNIKSDDIDLTIWYYGDQVSLLEYVKECDRKDGIPL